MGYILEHISNFISLKENLTLENMMLLGSVMLFLGIIASKAGYKFGVPSLLLFLVVGMFMGCDGYGIEFSSHKQAQFIGMMALSVILFTGGMDTRLSEIKPVAKAGVSLAFFGVVFTALLTSVFIYYIANMFDDISLSYAQSLLLASVMSSTDSASVFSVLRSKGLSLNENLRPLLELESGSNDPMAFMLTIACITYITSGDIGIGQTLWVFLVQVVVGVLAGIGFALAVIWVFHKIRLDSQSLYAVLMVGCVFFIYSATDLCKGNGYLAVYLSGLIVGNSKFAHKKGVLKFFQTFTWLWQIVMFLALGLLVNPSGLGKIALFGVLVGTFMMLLGRPLSVLLCMAPFRGFSTRARLYTSWVGLRGAVPIIFATYPFASNVPGAETIFNTVFFITILSLIIQGMTVVPMAKLLGVKSPSVDESGDFDIELPDEIQSALCSLDITNELLQNGDTLAKMQLPKNTLVIMVKRGDKYFVPTGGTTLKLGDKLLFISDQIENLEEFFEKSGIRHYKTEG